ncbi:hypothetical protein AKO1_010303 [Acrasis kona]|uniref:non-specific serine/threonine protein kinase n=1 Tax=Acrasis kona TaxID=1008807 RepID=A0AAW2ZS64_9EUKA
MLEAVLAEFNHQSNLKRGTLSVQSELADPLKRTINTLIDFNYHEALFKTFSGAISNKIDLGSMVQVASAMESLIQNYNKDYNKSIVKQLSEFYKTYFCENQFRYNSGMDRVDQNIIKSLLHYSIRCAKDYSSEILDLSDHIVTGLCRIWTNTSNDQTKITICQFLRLDVRLFRIESINPPKFTHELYNLPYKKVIFYLSSFLMILNSLTIREKNEQEEKRKIFMDLAADVLYLNIVDQNKQPSDSEQQQVAKKRRINTVMDDIKQVLDDRSEVSSFDRQLVNWSQAISILLQKHSSKLPIELLIIISKQMCRIVDANYPPQRLLDDIRSQLVMNTHESALCCLYSIASCQNDRVIQSEFEFWSIDLPKVIVLFLSNEMKELKIMKRGLLLLSQLHFKTKSKQMLSLKSQYFNQPLNVCDESLIYVIRLLTGGDESLIDIDYHQLMIWMLSCLKHVVSAQSVPNQVSHSILSHALLCLIKRIDPLLAHHDTIINQITMDDFESFLLELTLMVNPFDQVITNTTIASTTTNKDVMQSNNDNDHFNHSCLESLMDQCRILCLEYMDDQPSNSPQEEKRIRVKKKAATDFVVDRICHMMNFCSTLICMIQQWPQLLKFETSSHESIIVLLVKIMKHLPHLLLELSNDTGAWFKSMISFHKALSFCLSCHRVKQELSIPTEMSFYDVRKHLIAQMTLVTNQLSKTNESNLNDSDHDVSAIHLDDDLDDEMSNSQHSTSMSSTSMSPGHSMLISSQTQRDFLTQSFQILCALSELCPHASKSICDSIVNGIYDHTWLISLQFQSCSAMASLNTCYSRVQCKEKLPTKMGDDKSFCMLLDVLAIMCKGLSNPSQQQDEDDNLQVINTICIMLQNLINQLTNHKLTQNVRISLAKCLEHAIMIPNQIILDTSKSAVHYLIKDSCYDVRVAASNIVPCLLRRSIDSFDQIVMDLESILKEKNSDKSLSALLTLTKMACDGNVNIERRVLLIVCKLYADDGFMDQSILDQIIECLAKKYHYKQKSELMVDHLEYLWKEWTSGEHYSNQSPNASATLSNRSSNQSSSVNQSNTSNGTTVKKRKRNAMEAIFEDSSDEEQEQDLDESSIQNSKIENESIDHDQPSKLTIDDFPLSLFNVSDLSQFIKIYGHITLPILITNKNKSIITNIPDYKSHLTTHLASLYARCILDSNSSTTINDSFLLQLFNKKEFTNSQITQHADHIILNIITSFTFNKNQMEKALIALCDVLNCGTIPNLFKSTKGRIYNILLSIHESSIQSHRLFTKRCYFDSLQWLVTEWMGIDNLRIASTLRYVIHILLTINKHSRNNHHDDENDLVFRESICGCLKKVMTMVHDNDDGDSEHEKEIMSSARRIMTEMIKSISNLENITSSNAYGVLNVLLSDQNPQKISLHRMAVELLPMELIDLINECKKSCQLHDDQNKQQSIEHHIQMFLDEQQSGGTSSGLSSLVNVLETRRGELAIQLQSTSDQNTRLNSLLSKLSFKLTRLCREEQDKIIKGSTSHLIQLTCKCLGSIGLLMSGTQDLENTSSSDGEFDTFHLHDLSDYKINILRVLNGYLIHHDVKLVMIVCDVLQKVLNTKSGKQAFQNISSSNDLKLYLQPFTCLWTFHNQSSLLIHHKDELKPFSDELYNRSKQSHSEWIKNVCYSLISNGDVQDDMLRACAPICLYKSSFAELLFPMCILDISTNKNQLDYSKKLSALIENHVLNAQHQDEEWSRTVRLIIATLNALHGKYRQEMMNNQVTKSTNTTTASPYWMCISPMVISQASLKANSAHSALLFAELSFEKDHVLQCLKSDLEFEHDAKLNENLLLSAYGCMDEPDGIYGVNRKYGIHSQLLTYRHECDLSRSLGTFDVLSHHDSNSNLLGILTCLKNMGNDFVANTFVNGLELQQQSKIIVMDPLEIQELKFEQLWRNFIINNSNTNQQDSNHTQQQQQQPFGFHQSLYNCLLCLQSGDELKIKSILDHIHPKLITSIVSSTPSTIYNHIAHLQMIFEIQTAFDRTHKNSDCQLMIGTRGIKIDSHRLEYVEPILTLRKSIIRAMQREDIVTSHVTRVACMARKEGHLTLADNLVKSIMANNPNQSGPWMLEEARILWKRGQVDSAINVAKFLMHNCNQAKDAHTLNLKGDAARLCGKWMGQAGALNSTQIIEKYLKVSIQQSNDAFKSYYTLAKYMDSLLQSATRKLKSEEYTRSEKLLQQNQDLMAEYKSHLSKLKSSKSQTVSNNLQRNIDTLQRNINEQKNANQELITSIKEYLKSTMKYYALTACAGDDHDLHVIFRIVSLWFNHKDNKEVNYLFHNAVFGDSKSPPSSSTSLQSNLIPSRKFIPLIYQIASRLSTIKSNSKFEIVVQKVVKLICSQHAHHSLYQVLALKNGANIDQNTVKQRGKNGHHAIDQDKINAATNIIQELKAIEAIKQVVEQSELLVDAYIQLANLHLDAKQYRSHTDKIQLNNKMAICKISNLNKIIVPTLEISHLHQHSSSSYPTISKFDSGFRLAGGVNLPKIISCIGSDGRENRQLVKGKDDMRQDAVMQQIFGLVNQLLSHDNESSRKHLRVRTYRVIPLTPDTGVLGFVEHTMPMAEWLVGTTRNHTTGAHHRYRPKDQEYTKVRQAMAVEKKNDAERLQFFNKTCELFKPVMHHFFCEKFTQPREWFYKRLNYKRSVASNSIVGFVMGIGDRHAHNILLDVQTAECVHIDLGIAFDQGKTLPTPELVPFRLTRDVVDGFGVMGVEGVFRRCAEATMSVLRRNVDLLVLIVEVFIHDPLYRWSVSPIAALTLQRVHGTGVDDDDDDVSEYGGANQATTNESRNRDAESALLRLKEKLMGYENGESLGVRGQVDKLINEATSHENLSKMFHGWSSFL